ncbi:HD family phosphohydrolase [Halobacillus locisalis]|uniref:HD family phosphohydrolase n=1 Tax=Halobacillus locisalis TaxID=220753 RepID=UPI001FE3EB8A|nr:HDIG domain-containing metalloprotein [Halobacillus locisalis]
MGKRTNQTTDQGRSLFQLYRFWISLAVPALLVAGVFFVAAFSNVHTQTYSLDKYGTAPETIYAPITIENERETEQQIREVTQAVTDRYTVSDTIAEERLEKVSEVFEVVEEVKTSADSEEGIVEQVTKLRTLISEDIVESLPVELFRPLLVADQQEVEAGQEILMSSLRSAFEDGIRSTDLEREGRTLELKLKYSSVPESLQEVMIDIGYFGLVENALFDARKTDEARKEAISNVEPVMVRAGEVLVEQGATITNDVYEDLSLTGLLDEQKNALPLMGLVLFSLMLGALFLYESVKAVSKGNLRAQHIYVMTAVSLFMILLMKAFSLYVTLGNPVYYAMPAATGVLLIKLLCHERLAVVMSILYALMATILMNGQMLGMLNGAAGVYLLMTQLSAVFFLFQTKDRLSIVRASVGVAVINICTILFFIFVSFEKYSWTEVMLFGGYGLGAAFIAGVLTLGLLPFIETWFGILSDNKLLTLASPNQPLLRKILMEAPGTYHHSIMVANLSEAACESIGANGLLARVGAYYHDLGKTREPHYFIENQMGMRNPHDFLDPDQSAEIILHHPYEGADLLEKEKLPKEIVDIARQHHGTTLLKYFYYQAKENKAPVREDDFRYPGPKPQSKEAAVVCV